MVFPNNMNKTSKR